MDQATTLSTRTSESLSLPSFSSKTSPSGSFPLRQALDAVLLLADRLPSFLKFITSSYSVLALQSGLPRPEIGNLLLEIILRVRRLLRFPLNHSPLRSSSPRTDSPFPCSLVLQTFSNEGSDGESAYRTAVAFGNLVRSLSFLSLSFPLTLSLASRLHSSLTLSSSSLPCSLQLLSPSVSGSLHPGKSLQGKLLVKDLSSRFATEKRLQSIAEEIGRVAI